MKIALTGKVGSGKSTALQELHKLGWLTISTDELAQNLSQTPEALEFLKGYFHGGTPERAELRERFLRDGAFRKAWEEFLHPRIHEAWQAQMDVNPRAHWAAEVPLLYEKRLERNFDKVVVFSCSPQVALARWEKRGRSAKDYEALSGLLLPLPEKIARADFHVTNNETPEDFHQAICTIHERLLS